ncbi:hypothetical protein [uncultured Treponema sp.]|uniref:hypothetical protein n=1 Tax=uncultured Treponema sp. TaxID=162155 RepID=UPI0025E54D3F|nr:hypothetical protein [uncultured Treponema sp.]
MKFVFLLFFLASLFVSCSSEDSSNSLAGGNFDEPLVCVFYGYNGLGDLTYNDSINSGISKAEKNFDLIQLAYSPVDRDEARKSMNYIFTEIKEKSLTKKHVLCIFIGPEYINLLGENEIFMAGLPVTAFMFDTPESDIPESLKDKIHTVFIPYYGACYAAGKLLRMEKEELNTQPNPLIVLPDKKNELLFDYARAFITGLGEQFPYSFDDVDWDALLTGNNSGNYTILSLNNYLIEKSGFDKADTLYMYARLVDINGDVKYFFPLCGGSSLGLFHYVQDCPRGPSFSIIGVDSDMSSYAPLYVPFSVVKDSGRVAYELIEQWLKSAENIEESLPKSQLKTFRQGYTYIADSPYSLDFFFTNEIIESVYDEAVEYEEGILGGAQ